jgi:hypothetical protein
MYAMVDCTNYSCLGRHEDYSVLSGLAYIQYANLDTCIFREESYCHYARFDAAQLRSIVNSLYPDDEPLDVLVEQNQLRKMAHDGVMSAERFVLELERELVEQQAQFIDFIDDRPYQLNPKGTRPRLLQRWLLEPQRNRTRLARGMAPVFAPLAAPLAPATLPGPLALPWVAPSTPRAAGAGTGALPVRPRGGATGKVWDIADLLCEGVPSASKDLRKKIMDACEAADINLTTAGVQYSKWKKSHGF